MSGLDPDFVKQIVEALVFASDEPVAVDALQGYIEEAKPKAIRDAVAQLNLEYSQTNRAFHIITVAGGYQMVTREAYAQWVKKMFLRRIKQRLSQAALETLAVIAFKQPVTSSEVSAIRGVNCDGVLRTLLERKLITIAGRDEGPGRPLIYKTTREFLKYFGVNSLEDLPKPREIEALLREETLPEDLKDVDLGMILDTGSGEAEEETESAPDAAVSAEPGDGAAEANPSDSDAAEESDEQAHA